MDGTRLCQCQRLYLRTDAMLLLQLWQYSSIGDTGVRGEIIIYNTHKNGENVASFRIGDEVASQIIKRYKKIKMFEQ